MRALFAFLLLLLSIGASAQDVPPDGSVHKGTIALGRSTFALPPGEWVLVATLQGQVSINDGMAQGAGTAYAFLVQLAEDKRLVAAMSLQVPLASSNVVRWNDTLCDNKNTLHRDTFRGRFDLPECLLLNHAVAYWAKPPSSNDTDRKIFEWWKTNQVKLPETAIMAFYRNYFAGDYVRITIAVNPDYFGLEPVPKSTWAESIWHKDNIKTDPARLAFVERFKTWSYAVTKSATQTLKDRKPEQASLPSLEDLRAK